MRAVFARICRLVRFCLAGPGGRRAGLVFLVVLALELAAIYISVLLVQWSADFFDALEQVDADAAVRQVGVFAVLISLSAGQFLIGEYLRKHVEIRWRETLTGAALDRWLEGGAYWRMRPGFSADSIDNPDQRVAEDCRLFVKGLLREALDLIPAIVGLVTYVALLWSLSKFPLAFEVLGLQIEIPRYMVWLAFVYVALSSLVTHWLGRPLKSLYFRQQQREADFRYGLVRTREFAPEIALSHGEPAERRDLDRRFGRIARNWRRLMRRELIQGLFTRPYFQTVLRIPTFFALPAYLAGTVTLGGLMQLGQAFSRVTNVLSWFIFSDKDLAEFVATSERLDVLLAATAAPRPAPEAPTAIVRRPSADGRLRLKGLT
ncbi:MAG: SbmA/BacA-like family transporter, partial [Alphaproteobacteria bacterium]